MRIALVSDTYTPQVNGVTTVVHRIARLLERSGHDVAVVAPAYPGGADAGGGGPGELRLPSLPFPPYPAIRLSLPSRRRVARFLDGFAPELLHVATEGPIGVQGRGYALERGLPLMTSFHTNFPAYMRRYGVALLEPLVWRWLVRFHGAARLIHAPGSAVCEALRSRDLKHTTVWGRGVDSTFFHPGCRDPGLRRDLGVAADQPLLLHVGRLAPEKNLEILIESWRLAHTVLGERVAFAIAGEGPVGPRVQRAMPWARHLGFLDRPALAALYASADICVLPSDTETCGLVALEAMASGVAVVAADAGGFTDTIRHQRHGLLVPPHDPHAWLEALLGLVLHPERRQALAAAGRARAEERDVTREDQEILTQYQALIDGTKPGVGSCAA